VPALLKGSREELRSAFSNLVSNAVRYTPDGGRIVLRWEVRDGKGVFSVEDSGIGIPEEHIPRLTERFYRVDRGRSRESGGTGLGLSIVKHVLLRHQAGLEIAPPRRRQHLQRDFPFLARHAAASLTGAAPAASGRPVSTRSWPAASRIMFQLAAASRRRSASRPSSGGRTSMRASRCRAEAMRRRDSSRLVSPQ
jgi:hypothetical protein